MNGPKAHEQAIGVIGDRGSAAGSRGGPPRDEASQSVGLGEGAWCRGPRVARRSDHAAGHVVRQFGSRSKTEERSYYVTGGSAPGSLPEGTDRLPAEHPSPGVRGSRVRGSRKAEAARMFFICT